VKITAIQRQVKRAGRYSIFIDGVYTLSVSDTTLLEQKLIPGQELTAAEVTGLKEIADADKLYGLTLRYATLRMRSYWEVQTYLTRKHCPPALAETILNKLSKIALLDDLVFSRAWVENRKLLKPSSRRKIILELRTKHVSEAVISQALSGDELSDQESLRALVTKKRRMTQYQDDTKLMGYLARQGFNYDDIRTVLRSDND
jgi:regulatory protein